MPKASPFFGSKLALFFVAPVVAFALPIFADEPIPGVTLAVPGALGGFPFIAPSSLVSDDPRSAAYNPAAGADRELPAFGAVAAFAFPSGSGSGAGGYVGLSSSLPIAAGTFYALADGVFSQDELTGYAAPLGSSFLFGLSKAANDELSFGLSLGAAIASEERFSSGVYGAFGAQKRFPAFGAGGATVSVALLGGGASLDPWKTYDPAIIWTPLVSGTVRIVEGRSFSVSTAALFAFPGLSDLVASFGASFGLGKALSVDIGWLFSAAGFVEHSSGDSVYAPRFLPGLSVRYDGSSFLRAASYGASLGAGVRPVSADASMAEASVLFSRGVRDIEGPGIVLGPLAEKAYSPARSNRVVVPIDVSDSSGVVAWDFSVYDESGTLFFRSGENLERELERKTLSRLFSLRRSLEIPSSISIPLPRSASDGAYRIRFWARDSRGNEGRSEELRFQVDGAPPRAELGIENLFGVTVFTPNGDGVRDSLAVRQTGSVESFWQGRFLAATGEAVRKLEWTDSAPLSFVWDGKNDRGIKVADGTYSYTIQSVDAAGNEASFSIGDITVDSEPTPLSLAMDGTSLSPDRDGAFDSVRLLVAAPVKRGLADWNIELVSERDAVFRSWSGSTARLDVLPAALVFDGRSVDGDTIPDGIYRFRAQLRYANGNAPYAVAPPIVVDTKKPEGRVRASSNLMSLGRSEGLTFYHDLSRNARWLGVVSDASGTMVRELPIAKGGEGEVYWNGLDDAGNPVRDGVFRYHAEGRSATGISGRTTDAPFRVESGGAAVSLMTDRKLFSPSQARSAVRILPRLEKRERAISYSLEIAPAAGGETVRRFAGVSVPPTSFVWDGRDESDRIIADGDYRVSLSVRYETGGETEAEPVFVAVDGTPPSAKVSAAVALFSPNKDGVLDSIRIEQSAGTEDSWFAEIIDEKGETVLYREFSSTVPASFVWDGLTTHGDVAADGSYRYRLSAVDQAGNEASFLSAAFMLDARKPTAVLSIDKFAFSPNGDGFADALKLNLVPSFSDGVSFVSVRIVDGNGAEIRRLGEGALRGEYGWDGKTSSGVAAADGNYKAVAELRYRKGDTVVAESAPVRVDTTPPSNRIVLSALPFSPDDDGENDVLSMDLSSSDASGIAGWSFSILDPEGYPFVSFSGREIPGGPVVWDGSDPDGNLVEAAQNYSYVYLVRDQLGNIARSEGRIPVDVFVLRDGDRLKIRVSSINFAPNAASLQLADSALTERNRTVLDRIATVLGKFPTYRIRVEGHAVNLSGTEREERTELQPLSAARAKVVLDALVSRGIALERLEAVGLGGREPIVPHGDTQARWRNRRVEFVLVR